MTKSDCLPPIGSFDDLLLETANLEMYSCSFSLFRRMVQLHIPIDMHCVWTAIGCCCEVFSTREGFALLALCYRRDILPNRWIYTSLINGLLKELEFDDAQRFFRVLMENKLYHPDDYTYRYFINSLCRNRKSEQARDALRFVERGGYTITNTVYIYGTVIHGLCADLKAMEALNLFTQMICNGVEPDAVIYTSLINGLSKSGFWAEVIKLVTEMDFKKINFDRDMFSMLVDQLTSNGRNDEASAVINSLIASRRRPSVVAFTRLITGYCAAGEMSKARKVLHLMASRGRRKPNLHCFNALLNGYWKLKKTKDAMGLYYELISRELKPDVVTYNIMMQGLFDAGSCTEAVAMFSQIREEGLSPIQSTYRILMYGLCENSQLDIALELFYSSCCAGIESDLYIYDVLILCVARGYQLNLAMKLLEGATANGLKVHQHSYHLMIVGFCRAGLMGDARDLVLEMRKKSMKPTMITYNILVQGCLLNKDYDAIDVYLKEMLAEGFTLDSHSLEFLAWPSMKAGLPSSLLQVISKLAPKVDVKAT